MRKSLVAGNWKLNGSLADNQELVASIVAGLSGGAVEVAVCPPSPYLGQVKGLCEGRLALGAQDVSEHKSGAYTGEVAASMLQEFGVEYVIVGHSERRSLFGDSDNRVAAKFVAAVQQGLKPVLCLGETLEEREAGATESVVRRQLEAVLDVVERKHWQHAVIAYEPVWAIGTGKTATPEQAQEVHAFLRGILAEALGEELGQSIRLLYGGSVKPDNAAELFAKEDIDGGLIGGASLKAADFLAIVQAAAQ